MDQGASEDQEYQIASEPIEISNEFATVQVRKVRTRNGYRLEIDSPKLRHKIYLDSLQLECLTWASKELFDDLLSTPWGD